MVQRRYVGISDPEQAFEALRPFDREILKLMQQVRPLGSEYMILDAVRKSLSTAAYHFTGHPEFFAGKSHG